MTRTSQNNIKDILKLIYHAQIGICHENHEAYL